MNSDIKLFARYTINGMILRTVPFSAAIALVFLVFSFLNFAANRYIAFNSSFFLITVSVFSYFLFVFIDASLKLFWQIRFLLLAKGIKRCRGVINFSYLMKAFALRLRLVFTKLLWFMFFEGIPILLILTLAVCCLNFRVSLKAFYCITAGSLALFIAGFIFYSVYIQRYSRAEFYLACYENFTPENAVKESIRKTQGKLFDTFLFKIGFLPWFLLCIAIIPAFFVVPYYKQSLTCYYLNR